MHGRRNLTAVLSVVALVCGISAAQAGALGKGTWEVSGDANISRSSFKQNSTDLGSETDIGINALLGYCVTNMVEIVGGPTLDYASVDSPGTPTFSQTGFGIVGGAQVNFAAHGSVIPFARAMVGFQSLSATGGGSFETPLAAPIVDAGVRCLIGSSASANIMLEYAHISNTQGVKDVSENAFGLRVGFSVFPKVGS